jgi:hypothetical protein
LRAARAARVGSSNMSDPKKPNNMRLALILGSVALVFFAAVIAKRWILGA